MSLRLSALLSLALVCVCCSVPDYVQHQVTVTGFNFAPYTAKGFLFTPLPPSGEYESVGLITVAIQPEIKRAPEGQAVPKGYRQTSYGTKTYWIEEVSPASAIEDMYKTAIGMGADAVTQFSIFSTSSTEGGPLSITVYKVSGFAIKRK